MYNILKSILVLMIVLLLTGSLSPSTAGATEQRVLPKASPGMYAMDPIPLQPAECGQCHATQFASLKQSGGKHQFACQECHQVFHAYNPLRNNYAELMPKCAACHNLPHGPKQTDCLTCHRNPHAPRQVPAADRLAQACSDCHSKPASDLSKYPSAHTKQGCQTCHHDRHGYIPNCFECHDGHVQGQDLKSCKECHHAVHKPLEITFTPSSDTKTCSGCHDQVYAKWQTTISKHGSVSCGTCHRQHGVIPNCRECHAQPHDQRQLDLFPTCLSCHIDVHDLPVKRKK